MYSSTAPLGSKTCCWPSSGKTHSVILSGQACTMHSSSNLTSAKPRPLPPLRQETGPNRPKRRKRLRPLDGNFATTPGAGVPSPAPSETAPAAFGNDLGCVCVALGSNTKPASSFSFSFDRLGWPGSGSGSGSGSGPDSSPGSCACFCFCSCSWFSLYFNGFSMDFRI